MKNKGLFSTLFIEETREEVELDDNGQGRMATLAQKWQTRDESSSEKLWDSFLKQAISYLQFVPPPKPTAPNVYPLFEDYSFTHQVAVLYFVPSQAEMDDVTVGQFWPGKLVAELKKRNLNWGILTNGAKWRLYSLKTAKPYEDFVELDLVSTFSDSDEKEYALFERFFHRDSFVKEEGAKDKDEKSEPGETETDKNAAGLYKCRLDADAERSEKVLEELVKAPLLSQVDEILQYVCNGFIADTERKGAEYTEEERREIFESAVKLLYRALFLFYAEARSLLPSEPDKAEEYRKHSIRYLCEESRKFRWNQRKDTDGYDLWKHLKGLVNAVNDGDLEYGIMGYNGGLFDDQQEKFLGKHKLRNDFLARALYLLAYVEPWDNDPDKEYAIPYEDLEVRHLGELYENILEFNVTLADADRIRRRTKKGVELLLASDAKFLPGDTRIKKGDVFFSETALERKQTGSYYTPEVLVQFLNQKAITKPVRERFEKEYRKRFDEFCRDAQGGRDTSIRRGAAQSAIVLVERFVQEVVLKFKTCDPGMGSGHFLVNAANQISDLIVELLSEVQYIEGLKSKTTCSPNYWRRLVTRHCVYGVDLNPLAVHLAKLSLWLNCFAQDHRLTFLDHHLKCGNSLIGIRTLDQLETLPDRAKEKKPKNEQKLLFPMELKKACQRALGEINKIEKLDEDSTDKMRELLDDARQESSNVVALADLYTTYLIDHSIEEEGYQEVFTDLARGQKPKSILRKEILQSIQDRKSRHRFFHWATEFPEIFGGSQSGFDATTGNPPWDMVSAQPAEFFVRYDPRFRKLDRSSSLKRINEFCELHPEIARQWADYQRLFDEQNILFNSSSEYRNAPTGRNNLYHYFVHRCYDVLTPTGVLALVLPGSFNADKGSVPLRKLLFCHSRVLCFFCFSNEKFVFPNVHHAFRFILFVAQCGAETRSFRSCFLTDPREAVHRVDLLQKLNLLDKTGLEVTLASVRALSPDKFSVLEFKTQKDVDLVSKAHAGIPSLGAENHWLRFRFSIEMMSNTDAWRMGASQKQGIPVYAGRHFQQYDYRLVAPNQFIDEANLADVYRNRHDQPWKSYRLVFRDVAGGTSERTGISCILPPPNACVETARILYPLCGSDCQPEHALLYSLALLNSLIFDYLLRFAVRLHVSQHIIERVPFARCFTEGPVFAAIVARACRLVAVTGEFGDFWKACFIKDWQKTLFWQTGDDKISYGPVEEQIIRRQFVAQAANLTRNWTPSCGVHDRLPNRRDTGDRAQLRAEIDAYVAHLYGLSRDDFAYILDTFPVLKKKELQAFGEFRSKRKCLEEYDRLEKVLR